MKKGLIIGLVILGIFNVILATNDDSIIKPLGEWKFVSIDSYEVSV